MKIAIIGAGHAGVSAAIEAAKSGTEVTLFSNEEFLPYFRPRITGVAFGYSEPEQIFIQQESFYKENGIELKLNSGVMKVEPENKSLLIESGERFFFDKMIITSGAVPILPDFTKESTLKGFTTPLWTMRDALKIRGRLQEIDSIIIVGGGVIGVECAIRAAERGKKVTILEKSASLMSRNLSQSASSFLEQLLVSKGIKILTSSSADIISCGEKAHLETAGKTIETDLIILCIGCKPNIDSLVSSGLDVKYGVRVNQKLMTDYDFILSAGDAAALTSGQHDFSVINAISQGKLSARNACSEIADEFIPPLPSIDIKHGSFELHSAGYHTSCAASEERIILNSETAFKSLFYVNDKLIGVQMIGASEEFISLKKIIEKPQRMLN